MLLEILKFNKKEDKVEGMFDKCLFVLRNLSSLLERLCALQSRVFDRFFEAAEIAKFTSREFGEHWENLKSFRDWYSVMSTQLKRLSGNFWLVSFKISYLCLPLFYETRTTPSCHPSGCAYRQL